MYHRLRKALHWGFSLIYAISFAVPMQAVFAASAGNAQGNAISLNKLGINARASFSTPELGEYTTVDSVVNLAPASSENDSRLASEEYSRLGYTLPSYPVYQSPDGLTIEPIAAYNLIVDSNVLSPSSYGPSAATMGAKFCNSTGSAMTNVWAYIGNYDSNQDGTLGDAAPGVYPVRNQTTDSNFNTEHPHLNGTVTAVDFGDPTRFFALEHEAGSTTDQVDASRYLGTLAAGECRTVYWLVSYPRVATVDGSPTDVTGGVKPNDDLWLTYFFWGNADSVATSYYWRPITMRNEISAMANKIWPNGDNKVPDEYVNAIQEVLGWDTWTPNGSGTTAYPGETVTSQGIWYDLGNVGHGFDNDGDLVPDRNIWVQPIGDAGSYDPGCFRLVRAYGLIIIKLNDGTEMLIPFVDKMYFDYIPENNTGAVGLVFYEYVALDGACTAGLTPYQEVASGYDNEKFNGDFGAGIPPLQSQEADMTLEKSGDGMVVIGGTINYTMTFTLPDPDPAPSSSMTITVGNPSVGLPLVFQETIPSGTTYVSGSAAFDNVFNDPDVAGVILYSHDGGATFSTTQAPVNTVTHIQWWLDNAVTSRIDADLQVRVNFSVTVQGTYAPPTVVNEGCLKLGNADCFEEDDHTTLVLGTATIQGSVFADTNTLGNAIYETATETGIQNVAVSLYYDANGDGDYIDAGDFLVRTVDSTGAAGDYSFTQLPATTGSARYIVAVDSTDSDITTGYGLTTPSEYTDIALAAGETYGDGADEPSDFGFAPALSIDKRVDTTGTVVVGDTIQYTIAVSNILPGSGGPGNACEYNVWTGLSAAPDGNPASGTGTKAWLSQPNVIGTPDGRYMYTYLQDANDDVAISGFNMGDLGGTITKVELVLHAKEIVDLKGTDSLRVNVFHTNTLFDGGSGYSYQYLGTDFTGGTGSTYVLTKTLYDSTTPPTPTYQPAGGWGWDDFTGNLLDVQLIADKGSGAGSSGDFGMDAIGFRVTTDGTGCGGSSKVLNPVPLTDTFDDAYFDFVLANPPVSSSGTGSLTWNNVGPLYPGQTRLVTVTMRAAQAGTTTATDNTATSTGTLFSNGLPANSPVSDTATVAIGANTSTRSFSGTIFNDNSSPLNGWSGAAWTRAGTETGIDAIDTGIRGVRVDLYGCFTSSGTLETKVNNKTCAASTNGNTWRYIRTTYTDANGNYLFNQLGQGHYYALVNTSDIVGGQNADVNEAGICSTCDSRSNDPDNDDVDTDFVGNLVSYSSVTRVNFGYDVPAGTYNIGDLLFYDWDGNGSQDATDEGLSGVTVRLLDPSGALITTTTTAADGSYLFSGYPNGIYTVQVDTSSLPSGLVQTLDPEGDNNSLSRFTLNGANDLTRDFAYQPTGSGTIGDTVWRDMNGDGVQGGTQETGIPGVTVQLQVNLNGDSNYVTVATDTTDSDGKYLFENLPVGASYNYRVVLELNAANLAAIPNDAYGNDYYNTTGTLDAAPTPDIIYRTASITSAAPNNLTADFGFAPPASMGDTIFWDTNGNGTQDVGESGIPNAKVDLYTFTDANGNYRYDPGELDTFVRSDYTDSNGNYLFSGLTPGFFVAVVDTTTASYDPGSGTVANPILNPMLTSDPSADGVAQSCSIDTNNALCDARDGMRLYANTNYMGADFGFRPSGAFGDYIWLDQNGDGVQDAGEIGLAGVTVTIDDGAGTVLTTTTNSDGYYFFQNLNPNTTWTVSVTAGLPAGVGSTYDPDTGTTGPNGSTTVTINGFGVVTNIGAGACTNCNLNVDFGYRYSGAYAISGTVCLDESTDGTCGASETTYYQNVLASLVLWNDDGDGTVEAGETTVIDTQYTDVNGDYAFTGYPNSNYFVTVSNLPAYLTLTTDPNETPQNNITSTTSGGYVVTARQQITVSGASVPNVDYAFAQSLPALDYGDLPDTYKTLYAIQGPSHTVPAIPNLYLGSEPDTETNGVPSVNADGDDTAGGDDEDGVIFNSPGTWVGGVNANAITVNVTGSGYLYGWMDINNDGDFSDTGEKIITSSGLVTGSNNYSLNLTGVFGNDADIELYSRFRVFDTQPLLPGLAYFGSAGNGEVEDYALSWKMTVDKDTSTPVVNPGGQVEYAIVVRNTGDFPLTNVTISDNLSAMDDMANGVDDFTYASTVSIVNSSATRTVATEPTVGDTNLTWGTWDSIDPGGSVTIVFRVAVNVATPTDENKYYDNTVSVTSTQLGTVNDDGIIAQDSNTPANNDPEDDEDIRVVPGGDLSVTKDDGRSVYVPGQTLTYTINVYNSGPSNVVDATFADSMPALFDSWSWNCATTGTASCGATTNGTGDISANDVDINGGAGNSLTYTIMAVVSATATGDLTNTATITAPTGFIDPTPGNNTATDTDTEVSITPVKSIQATSESVTSGSDTLIGEILRYRLAFELPEGTNTNMQVLDDLVSGLRFLNDGTARVVLVCTTASNCTSSAVAGVSVDGNAVTPPTVVLPDAAISDNATTNSDNYPSGGPVYFKLGNITNNDNDVDTEYVVIEFNALVDNTASNNSDGTHGNEFTVLIDGTTVATSNNVTITVREPAINTPFTKTVTTTPTDGGDNITYTLQFTNSGNVPAYDIVITDTLNAVLEGTVTVGGSATCGGSTVTPALSSFTSQVVTATVTCLDPGTIATVTITAKVIDAAAAGQSFDNSANLTYTSLPGTNGTTTNPTGSSTPGTPGSFTGERTGSGTNSNDYTATSGTVTATLGAPTIDKLDPSPLNYVIGADVTYNICVTLPEGTIQGLVVTDNLPDGLAYQSHTVTNAANGTCAAATAAYVGDAHTVTVTRTSPTTVPGTSGEDLVLTFPTVTTTSDNDSGNNTFLVTVTARVLNIDTNQDGTTLSNSASLTYTDPNDASTQTVTDATAPADIEIVEPLLTVDKTAEPASVSSGVPVTFTLIIAHDTNSNATAYEVTVADTLPSGFNNLTSIVVTNPGSCATGVSTTGSTSSALNATIGTLPQGCNVTIEFDATADGTQTGFITNTANIAWTSLSGALSGRERDGSDGTGGLNDYVDSDPANVAVTIPTYAISGQVRNDTDGDGDLTDSESGLAGASVALFTDPNGDGDPSDGSQVGSSVTTPVSGNYTFSNVAPGNYVVVETNPAGYSSTADVTSPNNDRVTVTLTNANSTDNDFLDTLTNAIISDYIWNDTNGDGVQDVTENGISGVRVFIDQNNNNIYDGSEPTDVTDANGLYSIGNLPAGTYSVLVLTSSLPAGGYIPTYDLDGIGTPHEASVPLAAGQVRTDVDFGYQPQNPDIRVTKGITTVTFDTPQVIRMTYSILVQNTGNVTLNNVQVTDDLATTFALADSFSIVSVLPGTFTTNPSFDGDTDGGANPTHINLLAGTDSLAVGANGTITLVVLVDTDGRGDVYTNIAVARGTPPTGPDVVDSDSIPGPNFIDPAVTKAVNPSQAAVGDVVTFTITVFNNGNVGATGVVVTDTLPDNLDYVSATSSPRGTVTIIQPRTVQVNIGALAPTEVIDITIVTQVNSLGQPPIQNEVQVISDPPPVGVAPDPIANNISAIGIQIGTPPDDPGDDISSAQSLPATGFAPDRITALPEQTEEQAYTELGELWLEIPSLGVETPIVGVPRLGETWNVDWLWEDAGWLQGSAFPTWQGNSVLTGHVYLPNGKPGPFVGLSRLRWGNQVIVHAFGQRYIYEVQTNQVALPGNVSILKHEDQAWITLVTCKGYNEVEDSYRYRVVTRAVLMKVEAER